MLLIFASFPVPVWAAVAAHEVDLYLRDSVSLCLRQQITSSAQPAVSRLRAMFGDCEVVLQALCTDHVRLGSPAARLASFAILSFDPSQLGCFQRNTSARAFAAVSRNRSRGCDVRVDPARCWPLGSDREVESGSSPQRCDMWLAAVFDWHERRYRSGCVTERVHERQRRITERELLADRRRPCRASASAISGCCVRACPNRARSTAPGAESFLEIPRPAGGSRCAWLTTTYFICAGSIPSFLRPPTTCSSTE